MEAKTKERLLSLDVLRGFDMFWIVGGGMLIISLADVTGWGWLHSLAEQMEHTSWEGLHFEDIIFPLFMFISGVAIPYSIISKAEKGIRRNDLLKKVVKRGFILVVLGILYNGALEGSYSEVRFASVLGQVGLGYMFAAIIVLYANSIKSRLFWLAGIFSAIAILQLAIPVPGYGAGQFTGDGVINAWIDQTFLPGVLYCGTFDPEGLLCIVSAITVTLMGSIAGSILRDGNPASLKKTGILSATGASLIVISLLFSLVYPIIKSVWTVPFDLITSGISFLLLAAFYYVIDLKKWTGGISSYILFFFKVIGMNSIAIYMLNRIVDFGSIARFFLGWTGSSASEWIIIFGSIVLEWLLLYYLYKKESFIRV